MELNQEQRLPTNIKKALSSTSNEEWKKAAEYEMQKFAELGVWEAVRLFPGVKALGCQWVFEINPGTLFDTETFRAR